MATVLGPLVRGALAASEILILWKEVVALAHWLIVDRWAVAQAGGGGSPTRAESGLFLGKS